MKIGIVGAGVVGSATAKAWQGHCDEVRVYDQVNERRKNSLDQVLNCDVVFVCLPTPQIDGGKGIDSSIVADFFDEIPNKYREVNFVIKSTTPIGFTRQLSEWFPNVVHSPEFLTERTAVEDAANPRLSVIGMPNWKGKTIPHPSARLYWNRFPNVTLMTSDNSEAMKLVMNSWFATKVAFWNEVRTMTDALKLDYNEIRDAIVDEGRVHSLHTQVPGPDSQFGFGGKCLPPNLSELIRTMDALNLQPGVMRAAYDRNELLDRPRTA